MIDYILLGGFGLGLLLTLAYGAWWVSQNWAFPQVDSSNKSEEDARIRHIKNLWELSAYFEEDWDQPSNAAKCLTLAADLAGTDGGEE